MPVQIIQYTNTPTSEIQILLPILTNQVSLEHILEWITQENLEIVQMLNQDEFTSDVVVKLHESLFLVYNVS